MNLPISKDILNKAIKVEQFATTGDKPDFIIITLKTPWYLPNKTIKLKYPPTFKGYKNERYDGETFQVPAYSHSESWDKDYLAIREYISQE